MEDSWYQHANRLGSKKNVFLEHENLTTQYQICHDFVTEYSQKSPLSSTQEHMHEKIKNKWQNIDKQLALALHLEFERLKTEFDYQKTILCEGELCQLYSFESESIFTLEQMQVFHVESMIKKNYAISNKNRRIKKLSRNLEKLNQFYSVENMKSLIAQKEAIEKKIEELKTDLNHPTSWYQELKTAIQANSDSLVALPLSPSASNAYNELKKFLITQGTSLSFDLPLEKVWIALSGYPQKLDVLQKEYKIGDEALKEMKATMQEELMQIMEDLEELNRLPLEDKLSSFVLPLNTLFSKLKRLEGLKKIQAMPPVSNDWLEGTGGYTDLPTFN